MYLLKKTIYYTIIYSLFISINLCQAREKSVKDLWEKLETGLDYTSILIDKESNTKVRIIRINPKFFQFKLLCISEEKGTPKSLRQWVKEYNLIAAINASMYLTDGKTSTGYMRNARHINNGRIGKNFGAFFLAEPIKSHLPFAQIIEKPQVNLNKALGNYQIIIQNYRFINEKKEILWKISQEKHAIAAIAEDKNKSILFLHCQNPITAYNFAKKILELPLNIHKLMYVEGGIEASMALNINNNLTTWAGNHPSGLFGASIITHLPNVLGIIRKTNVSH